MLLDLFISLAAIFLLLITTEILWRKKKLHVETSRKIVHIGTGVIIAFWPHFLEWTYIQAASLALLVVVVISYKLHIFQSIHSIKRLTLGEVLYPVGIGLCALIEPSPWVFTVAILHLTLADGLAALVGVHYGKHTRYTIISHGKSVAGSFTFFATSFLILTVSSFVVSENALPHLYGWFLFTALWLTVIENLSWYGLDDITVPIAVIVILTVLPT